jgi:hypothetical protein
MMLVFCKEQGLVEKVAIPKSEMPRTKEAAEGETAEAAAAIPAAQEE